MLSKGLAVITLVCLWVTGFAQTPLSFDPATAFGARPSVRNLHLSPDGMNVAYVAPSGGQGATAYTLSLAKGALAKAVISADGNPNRLDNCRWVSNDRLVCVIYGVVKDALIGTVTLSRVVAVDADGKNPQVLSTRENDYSRGYQLGGGSVIDWLPDENGAVLMTRVYLPDDHVGSHLGSTAQGLGVDWIDTRTSIPM